jgi:hypothetical protein
MKSPPRRGQDSLLEKGTIQMKGNGEGILFTHNMRREDS